MSISERGSEYGVVVIGRNEGRRLVRCFESLPPGPVVYVDSGSSDGSVGEARSRGIDVVELDTSIPFTAARARNEGFARLMALSPGLRCVQFVDGDCELEGAWMARASAALEASPRAAVVCGRRRERFPDASVYNRLCDMEWDTPIGPAASCGGDFLVRAQAFREVGGFASDLIAGEEPEMCLRLARAGWGVERIDAEMTRHDADMHRFGQWWRRMVRSGFAYAEGLARHGAGPERYGVRPVGSILWWTGGIVAAALAPMQATGGWSLLLLALLPAQWARIARRRGTLYATFTMLGKWAQLIGVLRYGRGRVFGRRIAIIEYKAGHVPGAARK